MAVVGALASVASGAFGMMQANYQAKVAEMNAKIAKDNARLASTRGGIEAQMQDVQAAQVQGEQLSQQAASGVSVAGDSQIRTRAEARWMANADRMRIRENANYEAHGYRTQAANFKAEAASAKMSGIASMVGGVLSGVGDLAQAGFGKSLMGGATGTSASTSTVKSVAPSQAQKIPIPKPKPRPLMPTIGRSGLGYPMSNPLLKQKPGY